MKKLLSYLVLSAIVFLNMGAGCSDKIEDPKPDKFASLLGKWKLESYTLTKELNDGRIIESKWSAKDHSVNIVWDFKSDGSYSSSNGKSEMSGNWELKVSEGDPQNIYEGLLTLLGPAAKEVAKEITGKDQLSGKIALSPGPLGTFFIITFVADVSLGNYEETKKVEIDYLYRKL